MSVSACLSCSYCLVTNGRVCNVKYQPLNFGKVELIPCRTHWYLNTPSKFRLCCLQVQGQLSRGQRLKANCIKSVAVLLVWYPETYMTPVRVV
jgi:hypothetical protein